jgi:Tat protein secretion system quality control protein TatD with DNase activity
MAVTHSKPLYLHSRLAEEDFMMVLEEFNFGINMKVRAMRATTLPLVLVSLI